MAVVVPEITPFAGDKLKPVGSDDPVIAFQFHVYGVTPPEAVRENPLLPP
jgi:hypothetical protein